MTEKTCSDCIHVSVCENRFSWLSQEDNTKHIICHYFKDKTDVAQQKWIPVTERLPKRNMQCVCRYEFGTHAQDFYQVLDYYATDKQPHFQHELGGVLRVTHWMPLPQPPKGTEE